jgi:hypothetical protein
MVAIPFALTVLFFALPGPPGDALPLWAFLLLVVAFDVSHVWATLYISYFDAEAFRRRRLLFLLPVPIAFFVSYRLYLIDPTLFWTLLSYVAIHHFVSQHWGFVALYRLRGQERGRFDRALDKWTLWVGALGPVLCWHASARSFDWFGHGEVFLFSLPPAIRPELYALMGLTALVYLGRQGMHAKAGRFNVGKNLWMLASWLSWSLGIGLADHPLVSLACINLLHGIPFLVLVWARCADDPERGGIVGWLVRPRNLWAFLGILFLFALAEEGLWDGLVWGGTYVPALELSTQTKAVCASVLVTPQIVHYVLDAFLWKLDGSNPDLEAFLKGR